MKLHHIGWLILMAVIYAIMLASLVWSGFQGDLMAVIIIATLVIVSAVLIAALLLYWVLYSIFGRLQEIVEELDA